MKIPKQYRSLAPLEHLPQIADRSVVYRHGARIVSHVYPDHAHKVSLAQLGQRIARVWTATREEHVGPPETAHA